MINKHLIHKRSSELIGDKPKLPKIEDIEYGEIAINYGFDGETLSIKNTKNEIVTFSSDKKGGGGVSGDYVAKSGDTMSGGLIINSTLDVGSGNTVSGIHSFAQGAGCTASGDSSHAEGRQTTAMADSSHAEGRQTTAIGSFSHAEGGGTTASGSYSHAEGGQTTANGSYSHTEGGYTTANGDFSHAEGYRTITNNIYEHASGTNNLSVEGTWQDVNDLLKSPTATLFSIGNGFSIDNNPTNDIRRNAFEVKWNGDIYIPNTLNIGSGNTVTGLFAFAQGSGCTASANMSHAEGQGTTANGYSSHAEGWQTTAMGEYSHAEGGDTLASGDYSHAEGNGAKANGWGSHAEGNGTTANGFYSHTEGLNTITNNIGEHASGIFNTSNADTLFSVGNGLSKDLRSNAFEIKENGDTIISGGLTAVTISSTTITSPTIDTINTSITNISNNGYTKTEVDSKLDLKADKATTYTKTEVDNSLLIKANSADVYTKNDVDIALGLKADKTSLDTKVDKISGKGLSTNDYTNADKLKLDSLTNYDDTEVKKLIDAKLETSVYESYTADTETILNAKVDDSTFNPFVASTNTALGKKLETSVFDTYSADTQILIDGKAPIVHTHTIGQVDGLQDELNAKVDNTTYTAYTASTTTAIDNINTSITSITSNSYTKTEVDGKLDGKQELLESGTNIKTINNESILGTGNIEIVGGVTSVNGKTGEVTITASDLSAYTKEEVNTELAKKLDTTVYTTDKATFETKEHATATFQPKGDYAINKDLTDGLALKANIADVYTKGEVDALIPDISVLATKKELTDGLELKADKTALTSGLDSKVDKVEGKGLSTNDYTTAEKTKLASLSNYDDTAITAKIDGEITRATDAEKALDAKIGDKIAKVELVHDAADSLHYTLMVDSVSKGEINIPKDQFLKSASYDETSKELVFVFSTSTGDTTTKVSVANLVDVYTAGNGLTLTNNSFSIDTAITATKASVDLKANIADVYSKTETYSKTEIDGKIPVITDLASKTELTDGLAKKLDTTAYTIDKATFETKANASATYATKAEVTADLQLKQDALVSGTNIMTINGNTILGAGNLTLVTDVSGKLDTSTFNTYSAATKTAIDNKLEAAVYATDKPLFETKANAQLLYQLKGDYALNSALNAKLDVSTYNTDKATFETKANATATYQVKGDYATNTRVNEVEGKIPNITGLATKTELTNGLATKQAALVSGTNIKTVNDISLLGSGNVVITANTSDKVSKTGDTMTGPLIVQSTLNVTSDITIGGGITQGSDSRLKHDIRPLEDGTLSKVMDLIPSRFVMNNKIGVEQIGFVAQEMEEVYPEFVSTDATTEMKSVNYSMVCSVLCKAIQELKAEIDELKANQK